MKNISLKGMLPILALSEAENGVSGKSIAAKVAELTDGKWRVSPGSVYPLLRAMEAKGWVKASLSQEAGRREIDYFTTAKGRKVLEEGKKRLLREFDEMVQTMGPLVMRILHGYEMSELAEFKDVYSDIQDVRKKILGIPLPQRKKIMSEIHALCHSFKKMRSGAK